MPKFIFAYHLPRGYVPGSTPEATAAWGSFFEGMADSIVEFGQPVFERTTLGEVGATTQFGGYSIIEAADLEAAAALAKACPSVSEGGGVNVGLLADLPPDHAVSRLQENMSRS